MRGAISTTRAAALGLVFTAHLLSAACNLSDPVTSGPSSRADARDDAATRRSEGTDATIPKVDCVGDATCPGDGMETPDTNCVGTVDAGCRCTPGASRSCYTGPPETRGVGACETGRQLCTSTGEWGPCDDEKLPSEEVCGNGLDDDCDGAVDEGCSCDFQSKSSGVCADLTRNEDGACPEPSEYESTESSCDDGRDNDCDGVTDLEDRDCKQGPGTSCMSSEACRSTCVENVEETDVCAHRIFVTSDRRGGAIGGLSAADADCSELAADAGLGGEWRAILSTQSTSAFERIEVTAPILDLRGDRIADSKADLWDGTLQAPIEVTETEDVVTSPVWTGTDAQGASTSAGAGFTGCAGWTKGGAVRFGGTGTPGATDQDWIESSRKSCNTEHRLYCIEQ